MGDEARNMERERKKSSGKMTLFIQQRGLEEQARVDIFKYGSGAQAHTI